MNKSKPYQRNARVGTIDEGLRRQIQNRFSQTADRELPLPPPTRGPLPAREPLLVRQGQPIAQRRVEHPPGITQQEANHREHVGLDIHFDFDKDASGSWGKSRANLARFLVQLVLVCITAPFNFAAARLCILASLVIRTFARLAYRTLLLLTSPLRRMADFALWGATTAIFSFGAIWLIACYGEQNSELDRVSRGCATVLRKFIESIARVILNLLYAGLVRVIIMMKSRFLMDSIPEYVEEWSMRMRSLADTILELAKGWWARLEE